MATTANAKSVCNVCLKKVMAHAKTLKCSLCFCLSHNKCLPNYSDADIDHAKDFKNCWTCPNCLSEIFPFNCIENSSNFLDSISNPINKIPDILQLQNMVYDPFQTNDDDGEGVLGDVDPDQNFLNEIRGSLIQNCKYYYNTRL